ncbi:MULTISPECIES: NAD-dependent succinate-semialdehyde dehydrogenase [unclassified Streptomyces]|uniref:NAD-dependent succinate-semialdehyde dehydrogenase n=1 Tax=unclassified Streptomyces TaxID=2593676 RepID=UPI00081E5C38|nr:MULTISPECIES: NAD-dependent succinate-semialdehyde dehydrogenase [unclassified Streptomyces]MYZ34203.1 aldehyde dehydrogenase family protein [Streptomyces sp. SID4917]SCF65023.1 succinate semialdehyde dehydrogenase [Streptomyces sp. MnatMP-M17]
MTTTNVSRSDQEQALLASIRTGLFIDGHWRPASDDGLLPVTDPATGEMLLEIASATPRDGADALAAAAAAQRSWARVPARDRGEILRRAYEAVVARTEDFALIMTLEMGKTLAESRAEVAYAAEFLRWFSQEATRIDGRYSIAPDGNSRLLVTKKPVGPALLITPWNFPLAMATRKIGPALAAGCTVILKPAALTPLTALLFTQVLVEAGVPDGVVNTIPTRRAGAVTGPLIADPRLRKLSFTGSTEVGQRLLKDAADQVLRISMELGGNAPLIVFDDADLDTAVNGAMLAKFRNNGEACTAANRILVQEGIAPAFIERFVARVQELTLARGTDPAATVGPVVDQDTLDKMADLVADAVKQGATLATGGHALDQPGYFHEPTVLTNVPPTARVMREEIFGPVAPIVTFSTEQEALELANSTEFGLVGYAFTSDLNRGLRVAEDLEVGMLGLNSGLVSNPAAPFGGVKHSGLGREGGREGIEEYLEITYVGIADPRRSANL